MPDIESTIDSIRPLIERYFDSRGRQLDVDDPEVPLVDSPYGTPEVLEAIESMLSTYVTMGDKVEEFERRWCDYLDSRHGVMTNSGSSANLLAFKAIEKEIPRGAEVIVPAVGWSTAFYPIIDAGAEPVFVDVDPGTLTMDTESVKSALSSDTAAVMPIHLLGNPAPMDALVDICSDHDLVLIEDCAEAHGAEFRGKKVGTFGDFGSFSFSFSHHITTAEGGMVVTGSEKYRDRMERLRSWGRNEEEAVDSDMGFSFTSQHGYNLRPTEIQASFGIHQVDRMEGYVDQRRENAEYMNDRLSGIDGLEVLQERKGNRCSYLHYPLVIEQGAGYGRKELRRHLEREGIESRPLLSGNITRHPAFEGYRSQELAGADTLHEKGVYVSCHPYLTEQHMDHIVQAVTSFFSD